MNTVKLLEVFVGLDSHFPNLFLKFARENFTWVPIAYLQVNPTHDRSIRANVYSSSKSAVRVYNAERIILNSLQYVHKTFETV